MLEYERLKQNDLFTKIKRNTISEDTLTVFFHNVRSLSKHVNGILSNDGIMDDEITELTEKQINLSVSTCKIIETLNFFSVNFNNKENNVFEFRNEFRI